MRRINLLLLLLFAGSAYAHSSSINVAKVAEYSSQPGEEISNFSALVDNGYLCAGVNRNVKPPQFWMARWQIDGDTFKIRTQTPDLNLPDHTFMVGAGHSGPLFESDEIAPDNDIRRIHPEWSQGQIWREKRTTAKKVIFRLKNDLGIAHKVTTKGLVGLARYCATAASDGYILTGATTGPPLSDERNHRNGTSRFAIPRVAKIDLNGNLLWQVSFARDQNDTLDIPLTLGVHGGNCAQHVLKMENGNLVLVFDVVAYPLAGDGKTVKRENGEELNYANRTLIVELNSAGEEVARTRIAGENLHSAVVKTGEGLLLLGSYGPDYLTLRSKRRLMPHAQESGMGDRVARNAGGLRIVELTTNLKILRQSDLNVPSLNNNLLDVTPMKDGFFILGCGRETGVAIAYLDKARKLSNIESANPSSKAATCTAVGMATSPNDKGVVVLVDDPAAQLKGTEHKYVLYQATLTQ